MGSDYGGNFFDRKHQRQDRESIVLVEGVDDAYFLDHLLSEIAADPQKVGICHVGGTSKFEEFLAAVLKSSAFVTGQVTRYVIVRDADDNAECAQLETHKILQNLGEPEPTAGAFAARPDGRKVGLYIFPEPGMAGDLEMLCMSSLVTDARAIKVVSHIDEIEKDFGALDKRSKRLVQSYLAAAADPICSGVGGGIIYLT